MRFVPSSVGRVAVIGGAVLVLGGSAVGIAAAQSTPTPAPATQQQAYQKFIDALAKRLNISSQTLQTDIAQARQDAGLPADGGFGFGRGPGGPRAGFGPGLDLNAAAQAIGITREQLRTELAGKSLTQVAQAHTKDPTAVATALKNAAHARIDQAVADGRLTTDQGNTQKTNVDARIDQLMTQVMQQGGPGLQNGRGPGGPGGPGAPGRGPGGSGFPFGLGVVQQGLDTAAGAIGIPADQLRNELPGKSLAQVAQAHNVQPSAVVTALQNAAHTRIDQAVANNRLTADQANTIKTNLDSRINDLVNQVVPQGGFPRRGGPGGQQQDQTGA
jgi:hypothetical protein